MLCRQRGKIAIDIPDKGHSVIVEIGNHDFAARCRNPSVVEHLDDQVISIDVHAPAFAALRGDQHELATAVGAVYWAAEDLCDQCALMGMQRLGASYDRFR
jgi:hypothetical protein